jgi:hypothetical protein
MIRTLVKLTSMLLAASVAAVIILVSWSGYRVSSAMNHGALRMAVAMCMDERHLILRERKQVPQRIIDQVLARQILAHYQRYRKRRLSDGAVLLSSRIGWQTFWSADDRRGIYDDLERRMRPCPSAVELYRQLQANRR